MKQPTALQVARARGELTQAQAAALVYCTGRAWRYWEDGTRKMPLALWELFQIKVKEVDNVK